MVYLSVGVLLLVITPVLLVTVGYLLHVYICVRYLGLVPRIFQEKPLFIIPRGQPVPAGEEVFFPTSDGLKLRGCYLKANGPRRGVILFGLEYGSDCWSCWAYVEHLVAAGFDIFAFEPRNQGGSDSLATYEPLQWLTQYEVEDTRAAVRYLRQRPDADPQGIGFLGISKGGNAGLYVAGEDPYIRCCVTDGAFGTLVVVVPYMRQWFRIYNQAYKLQNLMPDWYFYVIARISLRAVERERGCRYLELERVLHRIAPRPWLQIHGEKDTYIKPEMALALHELARDPREYWQVPAAKHNQALHLAGDEYRARILNFFESHLVQGATAPVRSVPGVNGHVEPAPRVIAENPALRDDAHGPACVATNPPSPHCV